LSEYTYNPATNTSTEETSNSSEGTVETVTHYNMADLDEMVADLNITPTDKESLDSENREAN